MDTEEESREFYKKQKAEREGGWDEGRKESHGEGKKGRKTGKKLKSLFLYLVPRLLIM